MLKIPKIPPSPISSEELERLFQSSGFIEEFYSPPEVPKPPSCFEKEEFFGEENEAVPEFVSKVSESKETPLKKELFEERALNFKEKGEELT